MKVIYTYSEVGNFPHRIEISQNNIILAQRAVDDVFDISAKYGHRYDTRPSIRISLGSASNHDWPLTQRRSGGDMSIEIRINEQEVDQFVDSIGKSTATRKSIQAHLLEAGSDLIDGRDLIKLPDFYVSQDLFAKIAYGTANDLGFVKKDERNRFLEEMAAHARIFIDYFKASEEPTVIAVSEQKIRYFGEILTATQVPRHSLEKLVSVISSMPQP